MPMWNFLSKRGTVRTPLTPQEARETGATMQYRRQWECGCGARLSIRAKDSRRDGPSNYVASPAGHSVVPAGQLTWNGMAEERGWQTGEVIRCPACRQGMTVHEYKQMRRAESVQASARLIR